MFLGSQRCDWDLEDKKAPGKQDTPLHVGGCTLLFQRPHLYSLPALGVFLRAPQLQDSLILLIPLGTQSTCWSLLQLIPQSPMSF